MSTAVDPGSERARVETRVEGGVGHVVLAHPPLNILTEAVADDLREHLDALAGRRDLRVLVLSARGKHFSAGASVEEHLPGAFERMIPAFMAAVRRLSDFPVPVLVAVHGRCLGGGLELALAGDLIVASDDAQLGVPEIGLGVIPLAACVQLPRRCGPAVAAELVYGGAPIGAAEALARGIVQRVVPPADLMDEAQALADSIARHSAAALREAKKALRIGAGTLDAAFAEVTELYVHDLMSTADATEGLRSFIEKREPHWRHA